MKDEVGALIGLTWYPISPLKGWAAFLIGVLHSSSQTPDNISLRQISMGPTGFPPS